MTELDRMFAGSTAAPAPRRSRRWVGIAVFIVFLALLAAAAVVVDNAARGFAEDQAEAEIAERLPAGVAPVTAEIGGFAFLPQLLGGTLEEVAVDFSVSGRELAALTGAAQTITIASGTLVVEGTVEALGVPVGYTANLEPSVDGDHLVLTPLQLTALDAGIDIGRFLDLEELTVRYCVAELLPESLRLSEIGIEEDRLAVRVTGNNVPADPAALTQRGTCE